MKKIVIPLLCLLILVTIPGSSAKNNPKATGDETRDYYIRIEVSQWKIVAYDLNLVEDLVLQGVSSS